jgi:hypothetical protein
MAMAAGFVQSGVLASSDIVDNPLPGSGLDFGGAD